MRIDGGGNVGIGTASPAYPLDVAGIARTQTLTATQVGIGTTSPQMPLHVANTAGNGARFTFFNDPTIFTQLSESNGLRIDFSRGGSTSLAFRSSTDGVNFTERLRIQSDGVINVGGRDVINASGQALYA